MCWCTCVYKWLFHQKHMIAHICTYIYTYIGWTNHVDISGSHPKIAEPFRWVNCYGVDYDYLKLTYLSRVLMHDNAWYKEIWLWYIITARIYMPDRTSEYMSDKLSEYIEHMSKYISWNVMLGITRSKSNL